MVSFPSRQTHYPQDKKLKMTSIQGLIFFPQVHWTRTSEHQESTGPHWTRTSEHQESTGPEYRNGGNKIC
jgi:hypothetical protein